MDLLELILFILPAYIANAAPVIFGGRGPVIDFGKNFLDGKRILGDGKTFSGFFSGLACGAAAGYAIAFSLNQFYLPQYGVCEKTVIGIALAFGALAGDLGGSFIKRRLGFERGAQSIFLDQWVFLAVALALAVYAYPALAQEVGLSGLGFLLVATFVLHKATNAAAFWLKLKKVPW
jgi:CDP-2,3-bis-(O-geranylgeranyl)-sn-glycerol synthase